jgi:pyridoxal phosphate enzyme (YggS family)
VGQEEVDQLVALGVTDLAESRVHDARGKIEACKAEVCWHMIGSVQRRKAGNVVDLFDTVDSVDRLELAERLEQRCAAAECVLPVLLQVNVSGEESKHGFQADELEAVLDTMEAMPNLSVRGLMTMAPLVENAEAVRPYFAKLSHLADAFALPERSMGMTRDFEVAIEEGSTQVRIGSALF